MARLRILQRQVGNRALAGAAAADPGQVELVRRAIGGGGRPLDTEVRADMEARFGHDFGSVRVHTGSAAETSAAAVDANAYTLGRDVVFGAGHDDPGTRTGLRTLAHELTHVVQQSGSGSLGPQAELRIGDAGDRFEREADAVAAAIVESAPVQRITVGGGPASTLARCGPGPSTPCECESCSGVGGTVQRQSSGGTAPATTASSTVPRPAVLPMTEGFTLIGLTGLPESVVGAVPEGGSAELTLVEAAGQVVQGGAAGAFGGLASANTALRTYGLPGAAAGADAIGIVAVPSMNLTPGSAGFNLPDLSLNPKLVANAWGHTAIIVRQNGVITRVIGFSPVKDLGFLKVMGAVNAGRTGVPSALTADAALLTSNSVMSLEYPMTPERVAAFVESLPEIGPGNRPGVPELYTARPAEWAKLPGRPVEPFCVASNCGSWAVTKVQNGTAGTVGRIGQGSVIDLGPKPGSPVGAAPGTGAQAQIVSLMDEANAARAAGSPSPLSRPAGATGPAVAGRVPTVLRVVKIGGRVLLVAGIGLGAWEIACAEPEQRGRVTAGVAGGFAGGLALGATAGLVCGPGAPVCSIVAGLTLGIIGSLAGRAMAEDLYDATHRQRPGSGYPGHSIVCPSCHDNPSLRVPGSRRLLAPGGPPPMGTPSAFDEPGLIGPGRPTPLSAAEVERLRRWLGSSGER